MAFVLHALRAGDVFVDVGANVGSYSILACAGVGARGYAFEPVPATYRRLLENLQLNQIEPRVVARNIGIGRAPGTLWFTSHLDTMNHALADGEHPNGALEVRVSTLDDELQRCDPTLLKIDVEGYETQVLEGGAAVLQHPSLMAVIMETNASGARYGLTDDVLLQKMSDYGFRSAIYDPFLRSLKDAGANASRGGNTIFVRDHERVAARLKAAPTVRVRGYEL
jgi:FkbM family methyltransferase